jgi:hypothetical protein
MSIVDATTGHNPREEKKVAKLLYIALAIAIVVGFAAALMMSQNRKLNPAQSEPTSQAIPQSDAASGGAPAPAEGSPANQ